MRKAALAGFGAALLVGLVLALALGTRDGSRLVYSIGAGAGGPAVVLKAGQEACQGPLSPPPDSFDRVVLSLGTYFRPGPPVQVTIRDAQKRVLAEGSLAGGYPDIGERPEHRVPVPRTTLRVPVAICVRNAGSRRVAVYGAPDIAHRTSSATVAGVPTGTDLAVRLERARPPSVLSSLPLAFRRAASFKAAWAEPWLFWVLLVVVAAAVPALLAAGLARAATDD